MQKCPFCFEESVIKESEENSSKLVCVECGAILSEQNFTNSRSSEGTVAVGKSYTAEPCNSLNYMRLASTIPDGLNRGRKRIKQIAPTLLFTENMVSAALSLYDNLFYHEEVKHKTVDFKLNIAVCVVYIISRQYEYPITVRELVGSLRFPLEDFSKAYYLVLKIGNITMPAMSMSALTMQVLSKANFDYGVIRRTQQILEVFDEHWLGGKCLHRHLITAAAFLSWSVDHQTERQTSLRKFCNMFKLDFTKACTTKTAEMRMVLMTLALAIPWVDTQLSQKDIGVLYLDDILKYRLILRNHRQEAVTSDSGQIEEKSDVFQTDAKEVVALTSNQVKFKNDCLSSPVKPTNNEDNFLPIFGHQTERPVKRGSSEASVSPTEISSFKKIKMA